MITKLCLPLHLCLFISAIHCILTYNILYLNDGLYLEISVSASYYFRVLILFMISRLKLISAFRRDSLMFHFKRWDSRWPRVIEEDYLPVRRDIIAWFDLITRGLQLSFTFSQMLTDDTTWLYARFRWGRARYANGRPPAGLMKSLPPDDDNFTFTIGMVTTYRLL